MDDNPSYVHRLSDDIFFLIFKAVESSSTNTLQPLERKAPFNITLVSKHWRQLTLDMPALWTKIDAVNAHMLSILIDRSKKSPLVIEFLRQYWHVREYSIDPNPVNYPYPSSLADTFDIQVRHLDQHVEKLLPHIDRWGRFKIEVRSFSNSSPFGRHVNLEGLCSPAPRLQALFLGSFGGHVRLPVSLFQDHTPQLRVLNLHHVPVPLSSPIYTGLERLELDFENTIHDGGLPQLARNIASCPLLEYLRLKSLSAPRESEKPQMSVELPHLRCLLLGLAEPDTIYILSSFHFPALLKLRMVIHLYELRLTSMSMDIAERLPITTRIRSVRFKINYGMGWLTLTGRDRLWHESNTDIFNIQYRAALDPRTVGMVLPAITEKFPFPALEELSFWYFFHVDVPKDPLIFIQTIRNFPNITRLTLRYCPSSFLEALFVDPKSPSQLCPLLERLVIFDSHDLHRGLIRTIKSRIWNPRHVTPLRHLTVVRSSCVEEKTISTLRRLSIIVEVKDNDEDDPIDNNLFAKDDDLEYD